jgi:Flp pilus assembly protein TadD
MQYSGNFREAISVFRSIPPEVAPILVDRSFAEALVQSGRYIEALAIVEEYLNTHPQDEGGSFTSVKALILARSGKGKEADEMIARAVELGSGYGHFHHTAYNIASVYALTNRPDDAIEWLEKAADSGFPNYTYFLIDPNLAPIRQHPAFKELMGRLHLRWKKFKTLH